MAPAAEDNVTLKLESLWKSLSFVAETSESDDINSSEIRSRISRRNTIAPSDVPNSLSFTKFSGGGLAEDQERHLSTEHQEFSSPSSPGGRRPSLVDFDSHAREVQVRSGGNLEERDADAKISRADKAEYLLEKYVASDSSAMMKLLLLFTATALMFFGTIWTIGTNLGSVEDVNILEGYLDKIFFTFQILATGGYDDSFGDELSNHFWASIDRVNFTCMLGTGLVVFAVLVGVITTSFESKLDGIAEGRTKVAEHEHTLILGWNESTVRVVCQIAFLRRQWRMQNETLLRRLFPFLRTKPTTPVAKHPVVILCSKPDATKANIDEVLGHALAARNISPKRTKLGWDIVVRIGDPTSVHDLIRVNAHKATSIMVMMTHHDHEEYEHSNKTMKNGATVRTLLALRSILCSTGARMQEMDSRDLRIVVEMQADADFVTSACLKSPLGRRISERMDLTVYINSLMFLCAAKPHMSRVVMTIIDFSATTFRLRAVSQTRGGADNMMGALKGLTFRQACRHCCFRRTVLVGITNTEVLTEGPDGELKLVGKNGEKIGICPQPDYVIKEDDYFIFISPTSNPQVMPRKEIAETLELAGVPQDGSGTKHRGAPESLHTGHIQELKSHNVPLTPLTMSDLDENLKVTQRLLICGWRPEWTDDPNRFQARIADVAKNAKDGSFICCINTHTLANFEKILLNQGENESHPAAAKRIETSTEELLPGTQMGWQLYAFPNVKLYYVHGDSAVKSDLGTLLEKNKNGFTTMIAMGTMASKSLSTKSMDTRVLMILLLVRHTTKDWKYSLHTITENQLDQTADLAALPGGADEDPDFVNTRAIAARGLTMAMAYPRMQPAIREIFFGNNEVETMSRGRPQFDLIPPSIIGIVSEAYLTFGAIQVAVFDRFGGWAHAIGLRSDAVDGVRLAPGINFMHTYTDKDAIIIIRRKFYASTQVPHDDYPGDGV